MKTVLTGVVSAVAALTLDAAPQPVSLLAGGDALQPNGDAVLERAGNVTRVATGTKSAWGAGVRMKLAPTAAWDAYAWVEIALSNGTDRARTFTAAFVHPGTAWDPNVAVRSRIVSAGQTAALRLPIFATSRALDRPIDFKAMRGFPQAFSGRGYRPGEPLELHVHATDVSEPGLFAVLGVSLTGRAKPPQVFPAATFLPFVDKYGQFAHDTWPEKVTSDADFARNRDRENNLLTYGGQPIRGADAYGGWGEGPQLEATGRFRTEKFDGRWWLVDPDGHLFFSQGVDCVRLAGNPSPVTQRENYYAWLPAKDDPTFGSIWSVHETRAAHLFYREKGNWPYESVDLTRANLLRKWGKRYPAAPIRDCHRRLRAWGLNTIGNWSDLAVCTNREMRTPYCVSFVTDEAPRLKTAKDGYWGRFPDPFSPAFAETVRRHLADFKRAGVLDDKYLIGVFVDNELTWEGVDAATCEQYFKTIANAFRELAPKTLYLGCRFADGDTMGGALAWRTAARYADVLSANRYQIAARVPSQADGIDKPVLVGEFHFGALDRGPLHPGLVPVSTQGERAAAYKAYVRGALSDCRIVGVHWFEWYDQPLAGRALDGENYQIGFLDVCDTPYPEMVGAARELARELYSTPVCRGDVLPLAGRWRFAIVPADAAAETAELKDTIALPGTTDEAKKGDGKIGGTAVERLHPQLLGADMTRQLTMHASRRYPYVGVAAYERDVTIPEAWRGSRVTLVLERTKIVRAYLDGRLLGRSESLTTPARFVLPASAAPGRHVLRLVVDNRLDAIPVSGHQVSEDTQTNWNGVVGRLELVREDAVAVARVDPYPNAAAHTVAVKVALTNGTDRPFAGTLRVACGATAEERAVTAPVGASVQTLTLTLPADTAKWSEFTPVVQVLHARFGASEKTVTFGLRDFGTKGTQFAVNGRPTFLRGRHDACVWPLTGYAPMDVAAWRAYFRTLKDWGLNHVRCHSWVPPEAAFAAADELGFYLQPEFPSFGGDFAKNERFRAYVLAESKRVMDAYGHHPSFCLYTLANEPHGGNDRRAEIVASLRAYDPRHLYAQASNGDFGKPVQNAGDDFWATFRSCDGAEGNVRGSYSHADLPLGAVQVAPSGTMADFSRAVRHATVPLVGHEVGQYQAYPDYTEIAKYRGVLKAVNYEIFSNSLAKAGLGAQCADFTRASGRLVAINYREDVEEAIRTPGFGGFQLLDLQDFPGQGTALVGLLNAFLENKGFTRPETWRQVCAPTVLLARFSGYTRAAGETFEAKLQLAHYGAEDAIDGAIAWELRRPDWRIVAHGRAPVKAKVGEVADAAAGVSVVIPELKAAERWTLALALEGRGEANEYPLWVYPAKPKTSDSSVVETDSLAEAERLLAAGRRVLCTLTRATAPTNSVNGFFASDFWNWSMFKWVCNHVKKPVAPGTLGLLVNTGHPALRGFPTSFHADYQWRELVLNGRNVVLDGDREAKLIVQGIDNATRNHRLGVIWEKERGEGRLVVSAIDFAKVADRPEGRALKAALVRYLAAPRETPAFLPKTTRLLSGTKLRGEAHAENYAPWWAAPGFWTRRHRQKLDEIASGPGVYDMVFLGDSITHNWEGWQQRVDYCHFEKKQPGGPGIKVWRELGETYRLLNLGIGGDGVKNLLWRIANGETDGYRTRYFMLMIGTNDFWFNNAETTAEGIRAIVRELRIRHPEAKILLSPIFPAGEKKDDPHRLRNDAVNAAIRPLADGRDVIWLDFGGKFLDKDGTLPRAVMADFLHPGEDGYRIWKAAIEPYLSSPQG